jgi:hypothetical protein
MQLLKELSLWEEPSDMAGPDDLVFALSVTFWFDGEDYYLSKSSERPSNIDRDAAGNPAHDVTLIPQSAYQGPVPQDLTIASSEALSLEDVYTKRWSFTSIDIDHPERTSLFDLLVHEARMCERLVLRPHRNVCKYYGCLEQDGLLKGLY